MPSRKAGRWKAAGLSGGRGSVQAGRAVGDGVGETQHQAEDEPHHRAAVLLQGGTDGVDGNADAHEDAEAQCTQAGKHRQLQLEQAVHGLNGGQVYACNEQDGRAGDAGQHHGRDGDGTGEEQVNKS